MRTSFVNYRRALPLGSIFAAASIAAATLFIIYAAKWNVMDNKLDASSSLTDEAYENETKARYSYYGCVVSLLMLIVFFNGYHITKFR